MKKAVVVFSIFAILISNFSLANENSRENLEHLPKNTAKFVRNFSGKMTVFSQAAPDDKGSVNYITIIPDSVKVEDLPKKIPHVSIYGRRSIKAFLYKYGLLSGAMLLMAKYQGYRPSVLFAAPSNVERFITIFSHPGTYILLFAAIDGIARHTEIINSPEWNYSILPAYQTNRSQILSTSRNIIVESIGKKRELIVRVKSVQYDSIIEQIKIFNELTLGSSILVTG